MAVSDEMTSIFFCTREANGSGALQGPLVQIEEQRRVKQVKRLEREKGEKREQKQKAENSRQTQGQGENDKTKGTETRQSAEHKQKPGKQRKAEVNALRGAVRK